MFPNKTLFFSVLLSQQLGFAQVKFGKEKELGNPMMRCNEPAIAVNPINTRYQLIATNVKHMFVSRNGGKKVKHQLMHSSMGVYGDPVLLYDRDEIVYYAHLAQDKSKEWPESFDQIVIHKSVNNGKTWNDGIGIGKNGKMQDKPWMSVDDAEHSLYNGNLYLTWTEFDKYNSTNTEDSSRILFAKSKDKSNSFSKPIQINDVNGDCHDDDNTVEGATTCVGPNGEIYALWAAHQKLYFDKSFDEGDTWGKDLTISEIPEGWNLNIPDFMRTNGLPFLNSDSNGNLYACTAYEINGFNKVVVFESQTKGTSWNKPELLQQEESSHYMMPHAFLDKTSGIYAVIYYQVKNKQINVLLSYKTSNNSQFTTIQLNQFAFPVPSKDVFFGDYINVCVVNKMLACTWTETKGNSTVVKSKRVFLP